MKDAILLVLGALLGGPVGLVFSSRYQVQLENLIQRRRRMRTARRISQAGLQSKDTVVIAGHRTSVHIADGGGQLAIDPGRIKIRLDEHELDIPPLVEAARKKAVNRLRSDRQRADGVVPTWNSTTLANLKSYRISRSPDDEQSLISVTVQAADYYMFAATVLALDVEFEAESDGKNALTTLRRAYFPNSDAVRDSLVKPLPFLAGGVGVSLLVFTDDEHVVITRRRPQAKARPGQRDVSVTEGVHTKKDLSGRSTLDIYLCAARGCEEELGIRVSPKDVHILALAVDLEYYQWNFLGIVDAPYSASEVIELHSLHAPDRWEGQVEAVPANPVDVFRRFQRDGIWDLGLVAAYLGFCYRTSPEETRAAAVKIFAREATRRPWRV